MALLHRIDAGRPIRDAMQAASLTIPDLAEATKAIDPDGRGLSPAVIGFLVSEGRSARERCRLRTAWLLASALGKPVQSLFSMFAASTSTEERSRSDDADHDGAVALAAP